MHNNEFIDMLLLLSSNLDELVPYHSPASTRSETEPLSKSTTNFYRHDVLPASQTTTKITEGNMKANEKDHPLASFFHHPEGSSKQMLSNMTFNATKYHFM